MKVFSILAAMTMSIPVSAVTYCSTRKFAFPDPHQVTDYVERFVSSQNHASLFETSALVESLSKTGPLEWKLVLRKDPVINPVMVAEALSRQLLVNAKYESEEEAFLPAKLAGFDEHVKAITASGLREVNIELKKPLEEKALRSLLSSPPGIVFRTADLPLLDRPPVISGFGKSPVRVFAGSFSLGPDLSLKILDTGDLSMKRFRDEGCKRLYYPPEEIKKEIQSKKAGALIRASTTLLFIRLFNGLPKPLSDRLKSALHPDRFPSLKTLPQTNRITSVSSLGSSSLVPLKEVTELPNTFITCDHVAVSPEVHKALEDEVKKNFKLALGVELAVGRIGCERIALVKPSGDRIAVLSAVEYRSKAELERFLNCEHGVSLFGSCPTGPADQRENEVLSKGQVFPLAQVHNEFVEFF